MLTSTRLATERLLDQWGDWARQSDGLGYPRIEPHERACRGSTVPSLSISDDAACEVDAAVTMLKRREPLFAAVLRLYYIDCRRNLSLVARHMSSPTDRVSRETARLRLHQARIAMEYILFPAE